MWSDQSFHLRCQLFVFVWRSRKSWSRCTWDMKWTRRDEFPRTKSSTQTRRKNSRSWPSAVSACVQNALQSQSLQGFFEELFFQKSTKFCPKATWRNFPFTALGLFKNDATGGGGGRSTKLVTNGDTESSTRLMTNGDKGGGVSKLSILRWHYFQTVPLTKKR